MREQIALLEIIISIILIVLFLIQTKGIGLGRNIGSRLSHTKRGVEKFVFRLTIFLSIVFVVLAIVVQFF